MSFADKKGITITGGFKLNSPQPLDIRDVVETLDDLAELVSSNAAYEGMIVWVKSEKKSKQYDGKEWKDIASENASGPTTVEGLVDDVEISKYYGDTGDGFKGYSIDLKNKKSGETIDTAILNVDTRPVEGSENLITSGAVKEAIKNITVGGEIPDNIITKEDFVENADLKEVVFKTDFAPGVDLKNIASKFDIPENIITKGDFVDGADLTKVAFKNELFSGNYSDLSGKPEDLVRKEDFVENADLKKVVFEDKLSDYAKTTELFSKDYNDLTNKPELITEEWIKSQGFLDNLTLDEYKKYFLKNINVCRMLDIDSADKFREMLVSGFTINPGWSHNFSNKENIVLSPIYTEDFSAIASSVTVDDISYAIGNIVLNWDESGTNSIMTITTGNDENIIITSNSKISIQYLVVGIPGEESSIADSILSWFNFNISKFNNIEIKYIERFIIFEFLDDTIKKVKVEDILLDEWPKLERIDEYIEDELKSTYNKACSYTDKAVSFLTGDEMNQQVSNNSIKCNLAFCTQDASSGIKYRLGTLYYVLNNKFQPMQGSGSIEKTTVSTVLSIAHNKNSRYEVSSEVLSGIKLSCSIVNTNGSAVNGKVKVSGTNLEDQKFDPTYNNGGIFYIPVPDINRSSASTNTYSITATKLSDDDLNTYSVRNDNATITIYQPTLFGNNDNLVHYDKKTGTFEANISVGSQVFLYTTGTITSAASDENFLYSVQVEDLGSITLDFAVNGVSNLVYRKYRLGGAAGINDTTVKFYIR